MTMTSQSKTTGKNSAITWTAVQAGLWIGKANDEFAGMIEARSSGGYVATTRLAKTLGVFRSVAEAKASFGD